MPGSRSSDAKASTSAADGVLVHAASFSLVPFVRSAGILSISSVANLVRAIVTAKVLAVALGPAQVGVVSQLFNFSALLSVVLPLGLTTGVAKMVAEAYLDNRRVNLVAASSTLIAVCAGIVGALLVAPIAPTVSSLLTGSPRYAFAIVLMVGSFPLSNVAGVLSYILQGLADIRLLTWANVATSLLSLIVLVPATILYGLNGAAASVLVTSCLQVVIFIAAIARSYRIRRWRIDGARFSTAVSRELFGYGGVMLVGGIGMYASLLAVRTFAIRDLGDSANGLYQVIYGLSSQYMTIFMTWMAAYVFPRIAAEADHSRLRSLLNSALRANLLLMVPGLVAVTALRVPLVHIFYSSEFVRAADYIPVQALGDYAKVIGWSFGISLFARGHKGGHLVAIIAQSAAWVLLSWLALPSFGLGAISFGYALSYVTWPILMYWMARRWLEVRIDPEEMLMIWLGLACILTAALVPGLLGLMVAPILPLVIYSRRHRRTAALSNSVE